MCAVCVYKKRRGEENKEAGGGPEEPPSGSSQIRAGCHPARATGRGVCSRKPSLTALLKCDFTNNQVQCYKPFFQEERVLITVLPAFLILALMVRGLCPCKPSPGRSPSTTYFWEHPGPPGPVSPCAVQVTRSNHFLLEKCLRA